VSHEVNVNAFERWQDLYFACKIHCSIEALLAFDLFNFYHTVVVKIQKVWDRVEDGRVATEALVVAISAWESFMCEAKNKGSIRSDESRSSITSFDTSSMINNRSCTMSASWDVSHSRFFNSVRLKFLHFWSSDSENFKQRISHSYWLAELLMSNWHRFSRRASFLV